MLVSVIVVTKNEEKNIADCLNSLIHQDFPKDQYEIIVVDGCSEDRTQDIVRTYPVKLLIDTYGTLGHQRNTGIDNAKGKYVAFIDADCIADKSWLKELVKAIENSGENVAAVGGPNLVMESDNDFAQLVGYAQETFLGSGGSPAVSNSNKILYDVITVPNCNAIFKRNIITSVKYDDMIHIAEDADLNFRIRDKGYKLMYVPFAIVWHHRASSLDKFIRKMFAYGKGMAKITKKHRGIVRWYSFLPAVAVCLFIAYVVSNFFIKNYILDLAFIFLVILYSLGLFLSTIQVYKKVKRVKAIWTFCLLPLQHVAYGIGFFRGLLA